MKRILLILLLCMLTALALLAWSFTRNDLAVPAQSVADLPAVRPSPVRLSYVVSGYIDTPEGIRVRGGDLRKNVPGPFVSIILLHPRGNLLLDAGMGRDSAQHVANLPAITRALSKTTLTDPVIDQLEAANLTAADFSDVILTHLHWDHVSGLTDFAAANIWISQPEQAFLNSGHEFSELLLALQASHELKLNTLPFNSGSYGPYSQSQDFYGDGSIVIVPLYGHTPGSIGVFVTAEDGQRYFFIGDLSWATEGVAWPAERPWFVRVQVDSFPAVVREELIRVHQLQNQTPDLIIVPGHDSRALDQLPKLETLAPANPN